VLVTVKASRFAMAFGHPSPSLRQRKPGRAEEMRRLKISLDNNRLIQGGPFEFGNQVLISSHRKLLSAKATVVNVAEKSGHNLDRRD
jgi:hypothetical protein